MDIDLEKDYIVTGVVFGVDAINIQFMEKRHQSERGGIEQSLTLDKSGYEGLIVDIEDALIEVIEKFLIDLRSPPEEIPASSARARLRDRSSSHDEAM